MNEKLLCKLAENAEIDPETECWNWAGRKDRFGYGRVYFGKAMFTHRAAYELLVEIIKDGLVIDHLCRNTSCFNPDHLEPVTNAENIRRGNAGKMEAARTHCPFGHPYDEKNTIMSGKSRQCRTCKRIRSRVYSRTEAIMASVRMRIRSG